MNAEQLRRELDDNGVRPDAYSLDGRSEEAYCLDRSADKWSVYYYERGIESGKKTFACESDACAYLLRLLLKDPSAKRP